MEILHFNRDIQDNEMAVCLWEQNTWNVRYKEKATMYDFNNILMLW